MTVGIMKERPPLVRWEERELGLDQAATEREGRPIPRLLVMACITPAGSKDIVEKIATEWLDQIHRQAMNSQYPLEWSRYFRASYDEWLKGNELPREGTPLKTWSMLTKVQITPLLAAGVTTVEDLAEVPDSGLQILGLGGRYARDLARGWITEAKDKGINAKALADANAKIEQQDQTIASLQRRLTALEASQQRRPDPGDRDDGGEDDDILAPATPKGRSRRAA